MTHTIAAELASGYQPVVVDLNRDGRLDVIALSTRLDELAWYENPGWERHVLTTGLNRAINAAAATSTATGSPSWWWPTSSGRRTAAASASCRC